MLNRDDVAISGNGDDLNDGARGWSARGVVLWSDAWWEALGRSIRAVRGDAHDRFGCYGGERGVTGDSERPRVLAVEPCLGRQRLSDRLWRPAATRRAARGPHLPQGDVPGRPWGVYGSLTALWRRAEPGAFGRGPLRSGCWRRHDLSGDPWHDRHDVPRAARAGESHRRLRLRGLRRRCGRLARRRGLDPIDKLALDLLRQRPYRDRGCGARRTADRARRGHRVR